MTTTNSLNIFIVDGDKFYSNYLSEFLSNNFSCSITKADDNKVLFNNNNYPDVIFMNHSFISSNSTESNLTQLKHTFNQSKIILLASTASSIENIITTTGEYIDYIIKNSHDFISISEIINSIMYNKSLNKINN